MRTVYLRARMLVVSVLVLGASHVYGATSRLPHELAVRSDKPSPRRDSSEVKRVRQLDLQDFGVWCGLRVGDLDGDGELDFALAQNQGQNITCVTAMTPDGEILWRKGEPNPNHYKTSFDLPIQIYDLDADGQREVIYAADDKLLIRNGKTGEVERETELPASDAHDCIAFADFEGKGRPANILIKDRYDRAWALDRNLDVMWTFSGNTGHYPWPADFDGDGGDELVLGYSLVDNDGDTIWTVDLPGHTDGTIVADVDGNPGNGLEVGWATCNGAKLVLAGAEGTVRWSQDVRHAQHLITGDFRPDIPGLELAGLDRGNDRSPSGEDCILMLRHDGKLLWWQERVDEGKNRWLTAITTVKGWDGNEGDLILGYRRGGTTPPTLYDGRGRVVARLPFPDPEGQHFAQHADIYGDGREEIVVWDEERLYIYTNAACDPASQPDIPREPNKRLYNYTHYIGMP